MMNFPTKISYYQEKGKNYPQQRQHKPNFKPSPTDYDSDRTYEQQEKITNFKAIIKK